MPSAQSPRLIFRSSSFAPEAGEDERTNPGLFGRSLAMWVGEALVPGFSADAIIPEDFGWLVPVPARDHSLYVACSSTDASAQEWQIMVFAERGLVSRLLGKGARTESVSALYAAIRERLHSEPDITHVREED